MVLTIFIIQKLYEVVSGVLAPVVVECAASSSAVAASKILGTSTSLPLVAIVIVLGFLYTLGLFVQTRLMHAVDSVLARVPVAGTIFKAISNVFQSLNKQLQGEHGFRPVVLVPFPHPGMRSLAFVTNTLHDRPPAGRSSASAY